MSLGEPVTEKAATEEEEEDVGPRAGQGELEGLAAAGQGEGGKQEQLPGNGKKHVLEGPRSTGNEERPVHVVEQEDVENVDPALSCEASPSAEAEQEKPASPATAKPDVVTDGATQPAPPETRRLPQGTTTSSAALGTQQERGQEQRRQDAERTAAINESSPAKPKQEATQAVDTTRPQQAEANINVPLVKTPQQHATQSQPAGTTEQQQDPQAQPEPALEPPKAEAPQPASAATLEASKINESPVAGAPQPEAPQPTKVLPGAAAAAAAGTPVETTDPTPAAQVDPVVREPSSTDKAASITSKQAASATPVVGAFAPTPTTPPTPVEPVSRETPSADTAAAPGTAAMDVEAAASGPATSPAPVEPVSREPPLADKGASITPEQTAAPATTETPVEAAASVPATPPAPVEPVSREPPSAEKTASITPEQAPVPAAPVEAAAVTPATPPAQVEEVSHESPAADAAHTHSAPASVQDHGPSSSSAVERNSKPKPEAPALPPVQDDLPEPQRVAEPGPSESPTPPPVEESHQAEAPLPPPTVEDVSLKSPKPPPPLAPTQTPVPVSGDGSEPVRAMGDAPPPTTTCDQDKQAPLSEPVGVVESDAPLQDASTQGDKQAAPPDATSSEPVVPEPSHSDPRESAKDIPHEDEQAAQPTEALPVQSTAPGSHVSETGARDLPPPPPYPGLSKPAANGGELPKEEPAPNKVDESEGKDAAAADKEAEASKATVDENVTEDARVEGAQVHSEKQVPVVPESADGTESEAALVESSQSHAEEKVPVAQDSAKVIENAGDEQEDVSENVEQDVALKPADEAEKEETPNEVEDAPNEEKLEEDTTGAEKEISTQDNAAEVEKEQQEEQKEEQKSHDEEEEQQDVEEAESESDDEDAKRAKAILREEQRESVEVPSEIVSPDDAEAFADLGEAHVSGEPEIALDLVAEKGEADFANARLDGDDDNNSQGAESEEVDVIVDEVETTDAMLGLMGMAHTLDRAAMSASAAASSAGPVVDFRSKPKLPPPKPKPIPLEETYQVDEDMLADLDESVSPRTEAPIAVESAVVGLAAATEAESRFPMNQEIDEDELHALDDDDEEEEEEQQGETEVGSDKSANGSNSSSSDFVQVETEQSGDCNDEPTENEMEEELGFEMVEEQEANSEQKQGGEEERVLGGGSGGDPAPAPQDPLQVFVSWLALIRERFQGPASISKEGLLKAEIVHAKTPLRVTTDLRNTLPAREDPDLAENASTEARLAVMRRRAEDVEVAADVRKKLIQGTTQVKSLTLKIAQFLTVMRTAGTENMPHSDLEDDVAFQVARALTLAKCWDPLFSVFGVDERTNVQDHRDASLTADTQFVSVLARQAKLRGTINGELVRQYLNVVLRGLPASPALAGMVKKIPAQDVALSYTSQPQCAFPLGRVCNHFRLVFCELYAGLFIPMLAEDPETRPKEAELKRALHDMCSFMTTLTRCIVWKYPQLMGAQVREVLGDTSGARVQDSRRGGSIPKSTADVMLVVRTCVEDVVVDPLLDNLYLAYQGFYGDLDRRISDRCAELCRDLSDAELMTLCGVTPFFQLDLVNPPAHGTKTAKQAPYEQAVEMLTGVWFTSRTPASKIVMLSSAHQSIVEAVGRHYARPTYERNAEGQVQVRPAISDKGRTVPRNREMIALFTYCVVKSQPMNLETQSRLVFELGSRHSVAHSEVSVHALTLLCLVAKRILAL